MVTSSGNRGYIIRYFRKALRGSGKVYAGNSVVTASLLEADDAVITPVVSNENYIPFLLQFCSSHAVSAVIPLHDLDARILAHSKNKFAQEGITVIVPDAEVVDLCQDKWSMYEWLCRKGIRTPKTYQNLRRAIREIQSFNLFLPVVVKPRFGMGSIGLYDNIQTVSEMNELFFRSAQEIRTALKEYGLSDAEISSLEGTILQEKITGTEYSLDLICDLAGTYRNTVVKKKLGMRAGETSAAEIVDYPQLKELGRKIAIMLRPPGCMDVDVMVKDDGTPYVLEINPRMGGGLPFSYLSGVNIPEAIICWLKDMDMEMEDLHLQETVGAAGQKTIVPAPLVNPAEILIRRSDDLTDITAALTKMEQYLTPSLTERGTDLKRYALKLKENAHVWTAENRKGETIGMIAVYGGKEAYGTFLAVSPAYRRMHIAGRMFSVAMEMLIAEGAETFSFEVRQGNTAAINMYMEQGCRIYEVKEDVYLMRKRLSDRHAAA